MPATNHPRIIILDAPDYERLVVAGMGAPWFVENRGSREYVCTKRRGGGTVAVARLILDAPGGVQVRYRTEDTLDLRRSNLLLAA